MTTATALVGNRTMDTTVRPRHSLEELVDRLFEALFADEKEPAEPSAARSIHEARRLRQAGDVDGALAVLAEVDTASAETNQARWAFAEWKQLVKRRYSDRNPDGLQPWHGQGLRAGATRRRDAGGRRSPRDAVAARQGRLGTQPAGAPAPERRCVMVTANVDIPALKTRHPLGDTVEEAGVRLRGKGRVRQGVCPFHDEAEA